MTEPTFRIGTCPRCDRVGQFLSVVKVDAGSLADAWGGSRVSFLCDNCIVTLSGLTYEGVAAFERLAGQTFPNALVALKPSASPAPSTPEPPDQQAVDDRTEIVLDVGVFALLAMHHDGIPWLVCAVGASAMLATIWVRARRMIRRRRLRRAVSSGSATLPVMTPTTSPPERHVVTDNLPVTEPTRFDVVPSVPVVRRPPPPPPPSPGRPIRW